MHRLTLAISLALAAMSAHATGQSPDTTAQDVDPSNTDASVVSTEDTTQNTSGALRFGPLRVQGQQAFRYQEGMSLDEDYIQRQNKGNGDIATLLRVNPAVQFEDSRLTSSLTGGEIRPGDFSINGALPWQNLLLLDGTSFNNDIDPGASFSPHNAEDVPSQAQGIALDTDLLESLTVYDSNVPASFGGFEGGVVDARTRQAKDRFGGSVKFRMARSAWNELIIDDSDVASFEQSAIWQQQPNYDKYKLGITLEGRLDNGWGLIGTLNRTRSDIPLRGYSAGNVSTSDDFIKTQRRENTSGSLRADWHNDDGVSLSASISYAPSEDRYFAQNIKDSWFDLKQGGPVASLRASFEAGAWTLSNTLSYSNLESSRRVDSSINYLKTWRPSDEMDWGTSNTSTEGNWGNLDQTNRNIGYRFVADRAPIDLGPTTHNLQVGVELASRTASYQRLNDHYYYLGSTATDSCAMADGSIDTETCSLSPTTTTGRGQYLATMQLYREGSFDADMNQWSMFVQDDITIGRWNIRPGVRFDGDDLMDESTWSPRLAASWDAFGDASTRVNAGINRYYARNLFAYKLREGRESLHSNYTRSSVTSEWVKSRDYTVANRFQELRVPYTDEVTLGLQQQLGNWQIDVKGVNREGRDGILLSTVASEDDTGYYSTNVKEYVNAGRSSSDTYTLAVSNMRPMRAFGAENSLQIALDKTDVQRNYFDYDDTYADATYNRWVRYNGSLIRAYDLPSDAFNRPWTARLSTQTRWADLTFSNFLRYRAGCTAAQKTGTETLDGTSIDVYQDTKLAKTWTWDATVEYALPIPGVDSYVRVEASNVLNRRNAFLASTGTQYYEAGRSYWLEVGYRF